MTTPARLANPPNARTREELEALADTLPLDTLSDALRRRAFREFRENPAYWRDEQRVRVSGRVVAPERVRSADSERVLLGYGAKLDLGSRGKVPFRWNNPSLMKLRGATVEIAGGVILRGRWNEPVVYARSLSVIAEKPRERT